MPTPICSKCRRTIPSENVNVSNDVAYCRECNISYRLSDLTLGGDIGENVDLNRPPKGAWFINNAGGTVIGATNRSLMSALGLLFIALFWNGIVSVFVLLAIVGTLHNLHITLPDWFPANKVDSGNMGVGMNIFLWLFLTPFIVIGFSVAVGCLNCLFGKTEVRVTGALGIVFTGIGQIGWRRRFEASQATQVRMHESRNNNGSDTFTVLVETRGGKQIKFGSMLTNERRKFMIGALRQTLQR